MSDFYKSIGEIMSSGSSVNGKDAFVRPSKLPMFGQRKKAIDSKPTKPMVLKPSGPKVDIKLRPAPEVQTENLALRVKEKQKKVSADASTSKRTDTTTRENTSTSSKQTTSPKETKEYTTTMAKRDKDKSSTARTYGQGERKGDTPLFTSSTFLEPSYVNNEFNTYTKGADAAPFMTDGIDAPVKWDFFLDNTCLLRPDVMSGRDISGEYQPKLMINLSSFGGAITASTSNEVLTYNTFLTLLFNKYYTDVIRLTKGAVPAFWTKANFVVAMTSVVTALEYYYTLDSILSFNNGSVGNLSGSRSLVQYGNSFNDPAIMTAKDNIRRYLQGTWCPPELAQLVRKFFQYYRTSDKTGQSNIFRYCPSADFLNVATISTLITNVNNSTTAIQISLSTANTLSVLGLLSNMYPHCIINGLPKSSNDAVYDEGMLEIFINEPHIFNDANNANALSVFPISYPTLNNDIPYFAFSDPKRMNGVNFALQIIPSSAAATVSGYAFASTKFYGLRNMLTFGVSPSQSNKFFYNAGLNNFIPMTMASPTSMFGGNGANIVANISGVTTPVSTPPVGGQRVYFDQVSAPTTNFNQLASRLYGIVA